MFTVKGRISGQEYTLKYDGEVTGDSIAVGIAEITADALEDTLVGKGYQYTMTDHIDDPVSAYIILTEHVFDEVVSVTGDIPELDAVPDGAVV